MKILIYGFGPFKKYKKNISEEVVKKISGKRITNVILPVIPNQKTILSKIKKWKLEVILGIGQTGRGKLIRIERKAKNIYKSEKSKKERKISQKGKSQYLVNLKLKKIPGTRISYDAGKYLCNFSIYVIMNLIKKRGLKTKFAFLHIPRDYGIRRATRVVKKLLSQIQN